MVARLSRAPKREGASPKVGEGHQGAVDAGKPRRASAVGSELEISLMLQMEAHGIKGFTIEHKFHPTRRWRFDFAYLKSKIAIEVEGGTWTKGRHTTGSGFEKDCEKYNEAALLGWKVFRFTGSMVKNGQAIKTIREALYGRHQPE